MRRVIARLAMVAALLPLFVVRTDSATKPLRWILNGPALSNFVEDPSARRFFAGSQPFVIRRKDATTALPPEWKALPVRSFTSYAAIAAAFQNGAIDPDVRGILYDNEAWSFTPAGEQTHVADYTRRAAALVHAHGLIFLSAPAVNLVKALEPDSSERPYDRYVRLAIAGDSARYADVVVIQAQGSESGVQRFASFVNRAAAQARAANPHVMVLAGISTNPSGQRVTADTVLQAIDATRNGVDGYWFNVPAPSAYCPKCSEFRPDIALDVIKGLSP